MFVNSDVCVCAASLRIKAVDMKNIQFWLLESIKFVGKQRQIRVYTDFSYYAVRVASELCVCMGRCVCVCKWFFTPYPVSWYGFRFSLALYHLPSLRPHYLEQTSFYWLTDNGEQCIFALVVAATAAVVVVLIIHSLSIAHHSHQLYPCLYR